jgi:hypothetical protein
MAGSTDPRDGLAVEDMCEYSNASHAIQRIESRIDEPDEYAHA